MQWTWALSLYPVNLLDRNLDEAKASSRKIWEAGKAVSNRSILAEVRDRETFLTQKKTKNERQKAEQVELRKAKRPVFVEPEAVDFGGNRSLRCGN